MKVFLLAAGRSRRVKPIEDKNFLRLCGKFLIAHQVEALVAAGFTDLVLIGGAHNLERLTTFAKTIADHHKGLMLNVIEQEDLEAGMAGAVLSARSMLKDDEPVLIVSTNDVVDKEAYRVILDASGNQNFKSHILGKKVDTYFPGGYLKLQNGDEIIGIVEKPGAGNEPSDQVNVVLHLHKDMEALYKALEEVKTDRDDRYEVAIDSLIKQGMKMQAVPYNGYWQAIKFPWHVFEVARHFFAKCPPRVAPSALIEEGAHIKGDVVIDEGARVLSGATIVGPAYIGKNTIVATNALVRDSYLGENSVVGYSTEVARSVWGDDVWTHSNYIGDSLIGDNVSFGAGCVTGNLRFDEQNIQVNIGKGKVDSGLNKLGLITGNNIRVGVNTSFMPGVKINSDCLVGPGIVVDRDIEAGQFVRSATPRDTALKISENKQKLNLPSRDVARKKI